VLGQRIGRALGLVVIVVTHGLEYTIHTSMTRLTPFLLALLASCPSAAFNPKATGLPAGGNPEASRRLDAARARLADHPAEVAPELGAIARDYPNDPVVPYARLYGGMAAHRQGDEGGAAATLAGVANDAKAPDEVRTRARFWLGVADATLGRHAEARRLLEPFVGNVDEDDAGELDAALAAADAAEGDAPAALARHDAFWKRARPAERAYILTRVAALVDGLPAAALAAVYAAADKDGPVAAFAGRRYAQTMRAAGQTDAARQVLAQTAHARVAAGLPDESEATVGGVDADRVGALLPLSGKRHLVGEAAARGVAVAAGTYDRGAAGGIAEDGVPRPFEVALEDAGEGKGRAAAALEALAAAGAVAVVGPVDRDAADEAARRAETLAIPLVTLDVAEAGAAATPYVFRAVVPVEARARALADWAVARGARRFALLVPDLPYGARAAAAFSAEVEARGGRVVARESYKKEAVAFVEPVARVAKADFDALFIPDTAARLELIAPQLAVADLVVAPPGARRPKRGRNVLLVATAEAITPKFLRGSGRYTHGAALAPGFFPDDTDARIAAYVQRFRAAYGDDPTWLDAYAYDAALLVRAAVESGARDREGVGAALASGVPVAGLTGAIVFDASHGRADPGVLYTVVADGAGFAVRALRK
jgi:ABC-type branched-subunit amino acid transport system substrate-binding protein